MEIHEPLVLPSDVLIVPVGRLDVEARRQLQCEDTDFALNRLRGRSGSRILSAASADLLKEFRAPTTIVDAVIEYSRRSALDPREVLEDAFPLLQRLFQDDLLVSAASGRAGPIESLLAAGAQVDGYEVVSRMQLLDDTEVHEVVGPAGRAVLKVARRANDAATHRAIQREVSILRRLDGRVAPRLLESGEVEGRPFLVIELCAGATAEVAAEAIRAQRDSARSDLIALSRRVAAAYAYLHSQGVVHGDVHPRNLLVDSLDVRVIDFGLARVEPADGRGSVPPRGGIAFFFEPEYARARGGRARPPATQLGEQYSVAALIYHLMTGAHYADFSLERDKLFAQIAECEPLPFADHGRAPHPGLEGVLHRALSKDPRDRFATMDEMRRQLDDLTIETSDAPPLPRPASASARVLREFLLTARGVGSDWEATIGAPTCSVNYGAAGVAYALYRMASMSGDADLLSGADSWAERAGQASARPGAFHNESIQITPETVGAVALFHSKTGVLATQALIAHAMGNFGGLQPLLDEFVLLAGQPCASDDLTLGRSSLLLGASALVEALPAGHSYVHAERLTALGGDIFSDIWRGLDARPPLAAGRSGRGRGEPLGFAHGWAGLLFATIRWCEASRTPLPANFGQRAAELSELGAAAGRGMRWPRRVRGPGHAAEADSSWCNGSAGLAQLWVAAARALREPRYLDMAERALFNAWDDAAKYPSLCCGLAGRGYASLTFYRATGEKAWLERARTQAEEAAMGVASARDVTALSLYKGAGGVALLVADLEYPSESSMPFVEDEGWRREPASNRHPHLREE